MPNLPGQQHTGPYPFREAAHVYKQAGWAPIPLPPNKKESPPEGTTGRSGVDLSGPDIQEWINAQPEANVALRLREDILGIDVDAYDGKAGAQSLAAAVDRWGELPPTWIATSRDDGISGIRLFRVPANLRWPNTIGGGIETIRRGHRYAVVWPSVHPSGKKYRWIRPDGSTSLNGLPHIDDIPDLPPAWVEGLTNGEAEGAPATKATVVQPFSGGQLCGPVQREVAKAFAVLEAGSSRHDGVLPVVMTIARLDQIGHQGAETALEQIRARYAEEVGPDRPAEVEAEWTRMVYDARAKAQGEPKPAEQLFAIDCPEGKLAPAWEGPPDMPIINNDKATAVEEDDHTFLVNREVEKLRIRDEAKRLWQLEVEGPPKPPDIVLLGEVLKRDPHEKHRVQNLIPRSAGTLIVAQFKAGKTTFVLNLAASLLSGEPFLGTQEVIPIEGRVAFINYEVTDTMLGRWAHDLGIPHDRFVQFNARDRGNFFLNPEARKAAASALRSFGVETLIIDPFGAAFSGMGSENDAGEVRHFLTNVVNVFGREEVGAQDIILTTHAGWNAERARGSTSMVDWADSIIHLTTSDPNDIHADRFVRAIGRDGVDLAEDKLDFRPGDRRLTLSGQGSRKKASSTKDMAELKVTVRRFVQENPNTGVSDIATGVGKRKVDVGQALDALVEDGFLERRPQVGRKIPYLALHKATK